MQSAFRIARITAVLRAVVGALFGLSVMSSCSSAPTDYVLKDMLPRNLRVRRPPTEGANPKSNPGGADYQNENNLSNSCQKVSELFLIPEFQLRLEEIRKCFATLKEPVTVNYRLKREPAPYLFLDEDPKTTPDCLKLTLKRIPVPREIIFDSTEFNRLGERDCYTSHLDVEANDLLGAKLPTHKLALTIEFPLPHVPVTDDETSRLLSSWSVGMFRDPDTGDWRAKYLSSKLCKQCIGERHEDPHPIFWP